MRRVTAGMLIAIIVSSVFVTGCSKTVLVTNNKAKTAPPGQVKKATGSKSAQPYAPGQQKKK